MNFRNLVYPVFHPVVDVNGSAVYHEATLRTWGQRTDDGHARFLAVAEEIGFIDSLDCIICEAAIEAALVSGSAVGVNVSSFTVQNSLEDFVGAARRARQLQGRFVVELTETVQPDRMDLMERFVAEMRRLRAQIAVDDYGTGHFEAGDIRAIRPDYVKLAMPRVLAAAREPPARGWLLEAIKLANDVGAQVIAEGVENEPLRALLKQMGVRLFQGYLWGRPAHLLARGQLVPVAAVHSERLSLEFPCNREFLHGIFSR